MTPEEIAQWVINNRYPKSEKEKVSDAEMYHFILDQYASQPHATNGWISVEDRLPEQLETVWVSNGKGWTTLGCRSDDFKGDGDETYWCWAAISGGLIYEEDGKILAECEEDDWNVRYWQPLPPPPSDK